MAVTVTNQQPTELPSCFVTPLANVFDPIQSVTDNIVTPLFAPLVPNSPVTVDIDGTPISAADITSYIFNCMGDNVDPMAEAEVKEIFTKMLAYYDTSLNVKDVYAVQAGKKMNMILPSPKVIYTPTDIIDASKQFISGNLQKDAFFANFAFYSRADALGYYFANNAAFEEFKNWFANELQNISSMLTAETQKLCTDFQAMKLHNLVEGLVLRDDESQNNDPYSFARVLTFYLMFYEQTIKQNNAPVYIAGSMPFSFSELICPKIVLLVNVEKHAHAHPNDIKKEWDIINASIRMKPKVLSNKSISKLTSIQRMANKLKQAGFASKSAEMYKSANFRFRKTPPTAVDLAKYVSKIFKKASNVLTSENAVKGKKPTFNRPNRREPDNPDRQGVGSTTIYKPDLHLYIDCSGSISERDYQDAIKACIKLAKKLDINLYFNSFSHYMSQTTRLKLKGKTEKQIYKEFQKVPKVGGGTDYEQIWHYINRSPKLQKEISVVISDFEYWAPNHYVKHPRFLFYAPISTSYWEGITNAAESFAKSMLDICPDIRKHMLL